ncbi:hypothetical protein MNBD_BACTEROID03-2577 [hydrothermal vent metagenome]|uniref:Uncharacterized protein n=1 Tax=hydrothermal vent metagenome TaxID=652676 RepID=A0A3B0T2V7_9ZZZZ
MLLKNRSNSSPVGYWRQIGIFKKSPLDIIEHLFPVFLDGGDVPPNGREVLRMGLFYELQEQVLVLFQPKGQTLLQRGVLFSQGRNDLARLLFEEGEFFP